MKKLLLLPLLILLSYIPAYSANIAASDNHKEISIDNFIPKIPKDIIANLQSNPMKFRNAWNFVLRIEYQTEFNYIEPDENDEYKRYSLLKSLSTDDLVAMATHFEQLSDSIFEMDLSSPTTISEKKWFAYHNAALNVWALCDDYNFLFYKSYLNCLKKKLDSYTMGNILSIITDVIPSLAKSYNSILKSATLTRSQKISQCNQFYYLILKYKTLEAQANHRLGNFSESIAICKEIIPQTESAIEQVDDLDGDYFDQLDLMSKNYTYLGNQKQAINYQIKFKEFLIEYYKPFELDDPEFMIYVHSESLQKALLENNTETIEEEAEYFLTHKEKIKRDFSQSIRHVYFCLNRYYDYKKDYYNALAVMLEDEKEANFRDFGNQENFFGFGVRVAKAYHNAGRYKEAVEKMSGAIDYLWNRDMTMSNELTNKLQTFTLYSLDAGVRNERTAKNSSLVSNSHLNNAKKTIPTSSASEREMWWSTCSEWFEETVHRVAHEIPADSLIAYGCNAAILGKGFLLNADTELSRLISESGDKTNLIRFNELRKLRIRIQQQSEKYGNSRRIYINDLESQADSLERIILNTSGIFSTFTDNLAIDWKKVQSNLSPSEAAIEFVTFHDRDKTTHYAAYVLRHDGVPVMEHLFTADQLPEKGVRSEITYPTAYTSNSLSKILWTPLMKHLNGVGKIYFSPVGELYNIAIESMPGAPDADINRVSSTRELVIKNRYPQPSSMPKAAVFAGINYDTPIDILEADNHFHQSKGTNLYASEWTDSKSSSLRLRNGSVFDPLPETIFEGTSIATQLIKKEVDCAMFTGDRGTEAAFKSLDGKHIGLIHISTHGQFFDSSLDPEDAKRYSFLRAGLEATLQEDKAMTRNFLAMSGANNTLRDTRLQLPEGVDDGILTAREIASVDLRGLDLVVLSACQTGLGDISGEGVFGLQRGFKKAGANGILMSLWAVDDEATRLLMTKFYENYLNGESKISALRAAQNYVKNYTAEGDTLYAHPRFWAGFVLLDGLSPR